MYSDRKRKFWPFAVLAAAVLVTAAYLWLRAVEISGGKLREEGAAALRAAVERSALQCYVVEGVYPPGLTYLEENYGLQINRQDFYVTYDAFASNLPPDVRVAARD